MSRIILAAVFAAATALPATAGVTCTRYGNTVTCWDSYGNRTTCTTTGNTTMCY